MHYSTTFVIQETIEVLWDMTVLYRVWKYVTDRQRSKPQRVVWNANIGLICTYNLVCKIVRQTTQWHHGPQFVLVICEYEFAFI